MPPFVSIGPWIVSSYGAALALAVIITALMLLRAAPPMQRFATANSALLALALGLMAGRALYVLLNEGDFVDHLAEAMNIGAGGIAWQGAALGALVGLWLGSRLHRAPTLFRTWLAALPLGLLLVTGAGWIGCAAVGCGFGAEIQTLADSPFLAAELPNLYGIVAPRWNTPMYGILWSLMGMLLLHLVPFKRQPQPFWAALAWVAFGMFWIDYARGDRVPLNLGWSADQLLTALVLILSLWRMVIAGCCTANSPSVTIDSSYPTIR